MNILLFSAFVVSFEADIEDIIIAPPVDKGLIAAANDGYGN